MSLFSLSSYIHRRRSDRPETSPPLNLPNEVFVAPSTPKVPVEILEIITRYGEEEQLRTFSLVCQPMNRICRPRTFGEIVLIGDPKRLNGLFELLENPHNTIASAIRSLRLESFSGILHHIKRRTNGGVLGSRLVNIHHLTIKFLRLHELPTSIVDFVAAIPVRHVEFHWIEFYVGTLLLHQWRMLPKHLETLTLSQNLFCRVAEGSYDYSRVTEVFQRPLRFEYLDCTSIAGMHSVWSPLLSRQEGLPVTVKKLGVSTLDGDTVKRVTFIEQFVQYIGPQVEQIFIPNYAFQSGEGYRDHSTWSRLTGLKQIHIGRLSASVEDRRIVDDIMRVIEGFPTQQVQVISFMLHGRHPLRRSSPSEPFDSAPWVELLRRITEAISSLHLVKLNCVGRKSDSATETLLRQLSEEIVQGVKGIVSVPIDVTFRTPARIIPHSNYDFMEPWWMYV